MCASLIFTGSRFDGDVDGDGVRAEAAAGAVGGCAADAGLVRLDRVARTAGRGWRGRTGRGAPAGGVARRVGAVVIAGQRAGRLAERDPLVESATDLFRAVSFLPPPPKSLPAPPPPPPPKPSAPSFPYAYFGRMVDINGKTVTYLTRGDALIPIQAQQLLDNTYRIDAVTETQIVVTYVPLEEKIVIAVQSGK